MKEDSKKIRKIAVIGYTNYSTDPRVKREAEALSDNNYYVDTFVLKKAHDPKYELINGVNVYHLNQFRYRGNSNLKYIFSYLEFFIRIFLKISTFYFKKRYRVIHINNMPDFLVFTAIIPKLFGAKLILDIHDTMYETFSTKFENNSNSFLLKILLLQERISACFVDSVISVHYPQKSEILVKHGIMKNKITVVSNFCDRKIFNLGETNIVKSNIIKNKSFKMMYHGTISKRYGLDVVLKGLNKIKDRISGLFFLILGEGDYSKDLFKLIDEYELEEVVEFRNEMVPVRSLPKIISNIDLGIVSYIPSEATEYMLPTKLMEYIAMEKPVLCVRNRAISYYIKEDEIEFYDGENSDSFAEKLMYLYKNKKRLGEIRNNERKLNDILNWTNEKKKYILLIKKLVGDL